MTTSSGTVTRTPNAFIDKLTGSAVIVYGDEVETPLDVKKHTGPGTLENGEASGKELLPFTDFVAHVPGASDVWYEDIDREEGDSTVPVVSATGMFAGDKARLANGKITINRFTAEMIDCERPTELAGILQKGDVLDHTGLMAFTAVQRFLLKQLGFVEGTDFQAAIAPVANDVSFGKWLNPIESLNRAIYLGILDSTILEGLAVEIIELIMDKQIWSGSVPGGLLQRIGIDIPTLEFLNALSDIKLSSVALAGGGGSSDFAGAGSVIVDIFTLTTEASIGEGAQINQTTTGTDEQDVTVAATDNTKGLNIAGALGLTFEAEAAGVGIGFIWQRSTRASRAFIGSGVDINAGGDVAISTSATEDFLQIAASAAGTVNTGGEESGGSGGTVGRAAAAAPAAAAPRLPSAARSPSRCSTTTSLPMPSATTRSTRAVRSRSRRSRRPISTPLRSASAPRCCSAARTTTARPSQAPGACRTTTSATRFAPSSRAAPSMQPVLLPPLPSTTRAFAATAAGRASRFRPTGASLRSRSARRS